MKIAIDAMGGDFAPAVTVEGGVEAAREGLPILLVGDRERLEAELSNYDTEGLPLTVKHASEVVGMGESPVQAIRKKRDSSIRVCFSAVRGGEADAVVSAGNSGAAMAAAMFILKKLKGVDRPAIAVSVPTIKEPAILLDVGGNVDCKPLHMVQFAIMGAVYARYVLKEDEPRVGLLSNAGEEGKGNELTRHSHELLKNTALNYVGYVEGKEIYQGDADVIVSDGFVGNVVLKLSEGVFEAAFIMLKREIMASPMAKLGYFFAKGAFRNLKKRVDYAEYGGAPLLGIDGVCIISHGASSPKAIKNAALRAAGYVKGGVNTHLIEELERNGNLRAVM
ncbi:MAG: phosphate acyltransferase PlsX [Thermodesulfobacteriota bacterium]